MGRLPMNIKASGRSALIIAAGIWACFSGPLHATPGAESDSPAVSKQAKAGAPIVLKKYTKPRHAKKSTQSKASKAAPTSDTDKKAEADVAATDGDNSTAMPPSVANAHAQWTSADTPTGTAAKAMSARASNILQNPQDNAADAQPAAETQVVAADQLNELDRALQETKPRPRALALASAEMTPAPAMAGSNESSTWDQTSLIGKIFIAFGGLLTLASAARMFMA